MAYVIYAQVTLRPGVDSHPAKYREQLRRRVSRGQCYERPYLGCREFSAQFADPEPEDIPIPWDDDLGPMIHSVYAGPDDHLLGSTAGRSVRQILRPAAPIVRLRWRGEADCVDLRSAFQERSGDAVHAVHDPPVVTQDDGYDRSASFINLACSTTLRTVAASALPSNQYGVSTSLIDSTGTLRIDCPRLNATSRSTSHASRPSPCCAGQKWYCFLTRPSLVRGPPRWQSARTGPDCRQRYRNRMAERGATARYSVHLVSMETLPLSDVRSTLSAVVERVETTHERVTITRNGRPAAVLVNPADLEALEETLDVLSDPLTMRRLHEGEAAVAARDVLDEPSLREFLARRND